MRELSKIRVGRPTVARPTPTAKFNYDRICVSVCRLVGPGSAGWDIDQPHSVCTFRSRSEERSVGGTDGIIVRVEPIERPGQKMHI